MIEKLVEDYSGTYSVRVLNTVEDLEWIRSFWSKFAWHYFADIDFYLTIINSRTEILMPYIIVLCKNVLPETIVVGRIEEVKVICNFGYKTVYSPKARFLSIVYGGVMGNQCPANMDIIVSEILSSLRFGIVDLVQFSLIRLDSDLYRLAKSRAGFFFSDHVTPPTAHWKIVLPANHDSFMKTVSQKHRYWLRRLQKLLEKEHEGQIVFKFFVDTEQVNIFCEDVEKVAKTTYQRGLGVGFLNTAETRKRLELSAEKKWFRGYVLYAGDEPIAYWSATLFGKVLYLDGTGYNPNYRKYEPGTILFIKLIELAYKENDRIQEIDFGFGGAFYKERYGNQNWQESDVYIFSRTLKGLKINFIRSIILILHRLAEHVSRQTNLIQIIKKHWRKRFIPSNN